MSGRGLLIRCKEDFFFFNFFRLFNFRPFFFDFNWKLVFRLFSSIIHPFGSEIVFSLEFRNRLFNNISP